MLGLLMLTGLLKLVSSDDGGSNGYLRACGGGKRQKLAMPCWGKIKQALMCSFRKVKLPPFRKLQPTANAFKPLLGTILGLYWRL